MNLGKTASPDTTKIDLFHRLIQIEKFQFLFQKHALLHFVVLK